ncbi:MAG: sensor histidine kinase [Chitinophagales bacterium]
MTRNKYFIPGLHMLIWGLLLLVPAIFLNGMSVKTGLPAHFFLITNLYHIGLFYLNAYVLFPRLFNRRFWWLYFPVLAGIVAGSFYVKLYFLYLADAGFALTDFNYRIIFFPPVGLLIASFIFRLAINRIRDERNKKDADAERLTSELKFLRSQVSPHFLFNMMTNMVAMARQKSDLLEPSLIKLSGLLRYMLYEAGDEKFTLARELEYLESYIELQRLRFGENVELEFRREIEEEQLDCLMEPMLLIPFVENAFKHGIGLAKEPYIRIGLDLKNRLLHFSVVNNYSREISSKDKNRGIGLVNVRNRLKLLYPDKFVLTIRDNNEIYGVDLNLDLSC